MNEATVMILKIMLNCLKYAKSRLFIPLLIILLSLPALKSFAQNYADGIPSELFITIENALPNEGDLFSGYNWELHHLEINPGHDYYSLKWEGKNPRGYPHQDATIACGIHACFFGDNSPYYDLDIPGHQKWDALPGAYKKFSTDSYGTSSCRIAFWNLDGSIMVDLWVSGNAEIVCPEAERLAKLVYSRLPEKFYSLQSGKDFLVPGFNQQNVSPGLPADPTDLDATDPGLSGPGERIPDGALPLAAGVVAVVTALGALGVAFTGDTTPLEALNELKGFFTRGSAETPPPPQGRSAEEILANPGLHDRITDVNGKEWVYYHRPGDSEGDGWTDPEGYNQTVAQERGGKTYSASLGWKSDAEMDASNELDRIFEDGNREDSRQLNEEIMRDRAERDARLQAELERRNAIENKRFELEDLELQRQFDQNAINHSDREGLRGTAREIFTGVGKTFDPQTGTYVDSVSFKAMGLRMLSGIVSGGSSELFFNPIDGSYRVLDRMAEGQSFGSALCGTVKDMTVEELTGRGLAKGAQLAAGAIKRSNPLAATLTKETDQLTDALKQQADSLTKETDRLTDALKQQADSVENALKLKDPAQKAEQIKDLYKDGGMKKLGELERAGQINSKQANEINQVITAEIDEAVQKGTRDTLKDLRVAGKDGIRIEVEGVKVKEVMVGDSGSSARPGSGRSLLTDHDKTTNISFDQESLADYARKNGISPTEAQDRLNKVFAEQQQQNINQALESRGLNPADVDQKIYSGIGSASGQADSYPSGYTATRQATQGSTDVYRVQDGTVGQPYRSSGQTMTDQLALDRAAQTGEFTDIAKIGSDSTERLAEAQNLAAKQAEAFANINSAEKAAKALERIDKAAALADSGRVPPELTDIAKQLRTNPQETLAGLGSEGQRDFINAAREYGGQAIERILATGEVKPPWVK